MRKWCCALSVDRLVTRWLTLVQQKLQSVCQPEPAGFLLVHMQRMLDLLHAGTDTSCLHACRARNEPFACDRLHFRRLIFPWTDPSLGNCSYLDTCRHMKTCHYVHYELNDDPDPVAPGPISGSKQRPPVPSYLKVHVLDRKIIERP